VAGTARPFVTWLGWAIAAAAVGAASYAVGTLVDPDASADVLLRLLHRLSKFLDRRLPPALVSSLPGPVLTTAVALGLLGGLVGAVAGFVAGRSGRSKAALARTGAAVGAIAFMLLVPGGLDGRDHRSWLVYGPLAWSGLAALTAALAWRLQRGRGRPPSP
jgi:hypothetical protein